MSDTIAKERPTCFEDYVVLDGQGEGIPDEVKADMRRLWADHELGNDVYYWSWDVAEIKEQIEDHGEEDAYPTLRAYIEEHIDDDKETCVLIHFWW